MVRHNYRQQNKTVVTVLPSIDTRGGGSIKSRALDETITPDIYLKPHDILSFDNSNKIDAILVDEAQFLSVEQVQSLWEITKARNVPVICYGLRSDFKTDLFPAVKRLLALADSIEEIKTVCHYCKNKAIFNMQLDEHGHPIFSGDSVSIGYHYLPVCGNCYKSFYEHRVDNG
jgi:thymidine kinase